MLLQDILKTLRNTNGYTQEQIANKLFISTQAVSKWENGSSVPTIDNLLALSDLYDVSLDELVQGSPYFKKPYLVGSKYNGKKGLLFLIVWLLISLLFTGFGYQPFWIFLIIFSMGIFVVLPTIFNDYWVIESDGISIKKYSNNDLRKLIDLLTNKKLAKKSTMMVSYQQKLFTKKKYGYHPLILVSIRSICKYHLKTANIILISMLQLKIFYHNL